MSDVFLIFCAWFIFSCAFHVLLFTKWKKKGERFWKATDYWWICVGLIGLWGVAEEYERQQTTNRVHMQEASLEHEYSDQQSWIVTLMNSQIQVALLKMEETPNAGVGTRREVTQHIYEHSLYTRLQQAMSLKRPLNRHREELEAVIRDIHADPNGKTVAAEAGLLLNRAIGEEDELDPPPWRGEERTTQPHLAGSCASSPCGGARPASNSGHSGGIRSPKVESPERPR